MKFKPIVSILLPDFVFKVTFLDELTTTVSNDRTITKLRWVAQLAYTSIQVVILNLNYVEEESLSSRFSIDVVTNTEIWNDVSNLYFAVDYAIGSSGGYITWISLNTTKNDQLPTYAIAPIRSRTDPPQTVIGGSHVSVEHPKTIPKVGLPFWGSVSCLDFDDGHGILLIGSDAGQFCLVNFANALLPDEAFCGALPVTDYLACESVSKVHFNWLVLRA